MKTVRKTTLVLLALTVLVLPMTGAAQDGPSPLSEAWILTPKADQRDAFFEGLKKHVKYRAENGDPWDWQIYTPTLGDDLNRVGIRACCVTWADVDAYQSWGKENPAIFEHYQKHVAPHVDSAAHYFEEISWQNSHWGEDDGPFKLFAVTSFHVTPGKTIQFINARDKMSQIALDQGWDTDDRVWLWSQQIGGSPVHSIVVPHANYAGMNREGENFFAFLARVMGSDEKAEELINSFNETMTGQEYQVWQHQPDLSMGAED